MVDEHEDEHETPEPETAQEAPQFVPVPYYNPRIIDEQFMHGNSPYPLYFNRGVFVPVNEDEETSVRKALLAHGPEKPDRWRGDNRKIWTDRSSGFTTYNEEAKDDFEHYHQD